MISEREKLVCSRLRTFRELLEIPRSRFSISIGYATERIASYESGRAPVRYEVFKAVTSRYELSPQWLATGIGSPKLPGPFDDAPFAKSVSPRALFTGVYDSFIAGQLVKQQDKLARLESLRTDPPARLRSEMLEYLGKLESLAKSIRTSLRLSDPEQNTSLTGVDVSVNIASVNSQLANLLHRLHIVTKEPGKKSELADFLSAPLASVSRWLSGEREPGGETTLRMLEWVRAQEANQTKSPGRALTQPEPKTQLRKMSHEKQKPKSGQVKR